MSSHPCDTGNVAFRRRWLLIGGSFVYKMPFWGKAKWPPIGGWLLIRVAAHSRFYCNGTTGNKLYFQITFLNEVKCKKVCTKPYKKGDKDGKTKLDFIRNSILQNYQHHW